MCLDQRRQHIVVADGVSDGLVERGFQHYRLGQAEDAVPVRNIGRLVGEGDEDMGEGDVDNTATTDLLHKRDRGRSSLKSRVEVDDHNAVDFLDQKFLDRCEILDAGIVDQDVDEAKFLSGLSDQSPAIHCLRHVSRM